MKKSYLNILWAMALPIFMGSCSEEDFGDADASGLPSVETVSDAISITVDQNTNVVTFEITNALKGCYPVWEFGAGYSDDKSSSTLKRVTKTYKSRGDYSVTVQLGNKNGLSDGVINKTFHINRNLVATSQAKALTNNVLYWNFVADGHFGCGSSGNSDLSKYGLDWWSCGAFGKSGSAMYDDSFEFKSDASADATTISGTYKYDPGEDGQIYCEKGVTFAPFGSFNTNDGQDFPAKTEIQNSTWKLYYDETDILWLEFAPKSMVSFIPNEEIWNTPKFRVVELTEKKVVLIADNGGIAWRYVFCPASQNEIDDIGGPNYAEAIVGTWTWNSGKNGHFGCGDSVDNPLGWWSCGADEKAGKGLYDDVMTFTADSYTFDPGADGTIYVNKDCTYEPDSKGNDGGTGNDYIAPAAKQTTTYEIKEEGGAYYLVLPAKTHFSYMSGDAVYNSPKYLIKRISKDKSIIELASVQPGISWFYQLKKVK